MVTLQKETPTTAAAKQRAHKERMHLLKGSRFLVGFLEKSTSRSVIADRGQRKQANYFVCYLACVLGQRIFVMSILNQYNWLF